jgi:hypothetical protein
MTCETITTNFKDRFERPFIVDQTSGEREYDFPDVDKEMSVDGTVYRNDKGDLGYLVQIVTTDDLCNSTGTIDTTSQTNNQSRGVYNFQKCPTKQTAFITITDFDAKLASFLEELNLTKYINGMWLCTQYSIPDCIPMLHINNVSQVRIQASNDKRLHLDGIIKLYVDTFEIYEEYPLKESTMIHIKRYYKEQNCLKYKCSMFVDPESRINTVFASFQCVEETYGFLNPHLNRLNTNNTFEDEYITNGSIIIYSKDCKSNADFEGLTKLMQKI